MDYILLIYLSPFVLGGLWIVWHLHLERQLNKAASNVSELEFSKLVTELQAVGTTTSKSFFLRAKRGEPASSTFHVRLPSEMDIESLKGACIKVALAADPPSVDDLGEVTIIEGTPPETDFDLIAIPRIGFKNGGGANQYQPKGWFKRNPSLLRLAKEIYPHDPDGFMAALIWGAGRVNSPFEWIQSPPKLRCKSCSGKMLPVLQIYGGSVGLNKEADYYIAACPDEANQFQIYVQFS